MKLFLFIVSCLLLWGCQEYEYDDLEEKSTAACGKKLEDLPWLKEWIDAYRENPDSQYCQLSSVEQGVYQGQTVFVVQVGGALCCTCAGATVVNCQGETVFICEPDQEKKIKNSKQVWSR